MKIIQKNKKIHLNYLIIKKFEVGIVLTGLEIKAIKQYGFQLENSYVIIKNDELFLLNGVVNISNRNANNFIENNPSRTRKLLAHKREIHRWRIQKLKNDYAIIPVKTYLRNSVLKVEIAFCKGRKKQDKRNYLKEKALKKDYRGIKI